MPDSPEPGERGLRNVVVHAYFGIDREAVWATIEGELQTLTDDLVPILDRLEAER